MPYAADKDFKSAAEKEWTFHTARVNCSAWSPDSRFIATGGIDTNVIVWDLKHSGEHPIIIRGWASSLPFLNRLKGKANFHFFFLLALHLKIVL